MRYSNPDRIFQTELACQETGESLLEWVSMSKMLDTDKETSTVTLSMSPLESNH